MVDALGSNFAVERLDEAVAGWRAEPRKIERYSVHVTAAVLQPYQKSIFANPFRHSHAPFMQLANL